MVFENNSNKGMVVSKEPFANSLYNHLRLKPYIVFDKNDYLSKLFAFDGTVSATDKETFMFVYDMETKNFIWSNDLRQYVADEFGTLVYKHKHAKAVVFDKPVFKVIIVNLKETYMVIEEYCVNNVFYKDGAPVFKYNTSENHLLFYDTKAVKRKYGKGDKAKWYDLPMREDFDFVDGNLFLNMPEFELVKQFRDQWQFLAHCGYEVEGDVVYSQVLTCKSFEEVLKAKYEDFDEVARYVDLDDVHYWEFIQIRKLKSLLSDAEFMRFMDWCWASGRDIYLDCLGNGIVNFSHNSVRHGSRGTTYVPSTQMIGALTSMQAQIWLGAQEVEPSLKKMSALVLYVIFLASRLQFDFDSFGYFDELVLWTYVMNYSTLAKFKGGKIDSSCICSRDDLGAFVSRSEIILSNLDTKCANRGAKIERKGWYSLLSRIKKDAPEIKPLLSVTAMVTYANDHVIRADKFMGQVFRYGRLPLAYQVGDDHYLILASKIKKGRYKIFRMYDVTDMDADVDPDLFPDLQEVIEV